MKKSPFFFLFILISLLGITQVKADTIHIQMPGGIQNICASSGFNTYIFHKPFVYGSTIWRVENVIVGSGDSLIYTPTTIGSILIFCTWSGNGEGCVLDLYPSAPSHALLQGSNINNDTVFMCGPTVTIGFQLNGYLTNESVVGDFHWGKIGDINFLPTENPVTITDPGVYFNYKENICGITIDTFNVIQLPYTAPILSDTIFCNQTSNTTFDAGPGWTSYLWSTGANSQAITPTITTDGVHNYTLTVNNVCGTFNSSATIEVQHFPLPGFPIPFGPYCNDTTLIVNPNPNYVYDSYTWSTGTTGQFIYVNDDLSWHCTVTKGDCSATSSRTVRFYEEPLKPEVCVVTVDAGVSKNKIVWTSDNEPYSGHYEYNMIESYNIYKLVNNWMLIGTVQATDDHVFTDMSSNPSTQSAMYKITSVDDCGNESEKSYYHKTILLLANQGAYPGQIPLNWNQYEDESDQFMVSQYYIYRGPSMNQLSLYDSVPRLMTSYIDIGVYSQTFYQIVVVKEGGCDPSPANSGKGTKNITNGLIMSNVTQIGLGIEENKIDVTIYPNPSNNGIFKIKGENITSIEVYNAIGQQIITTTDYNSTLDLSNQSNGIYYAKISTEKGNVVKKLVKQ